MDPVKRLVHSAGYQISLTQVTHLRYRPSRHSFPCAEPSARPSASTVCLTQLVAVTCLPWTGPVLERTALGLGAGLMLSALVGKGAAGLRGTDPEQPGYIEAWRLCCPAQRGLLVIMPSRAAAVVKIVNGQPALRLRPPVQLPDELLQLLWRGQNYS